jgi:hypothetical protein
LNISIHPGNAFASQAPRQPTRSFSPREKAEDFVGCSNAELVTIDPLELNLLVAKGIPQLRDLDIARYRDMANEWAEAIRGNLPSAEANFYRTPGKWKNDIRFARLATVCWYVDRVLGVRYREGLKGLEQVEYLDPGDLFLNGVMDHRRGTCGNMGMLHVALGWRFGWPVSLACAYSHLICRYDDGEVIHNIEATNNAEGVFSSPPDEYYRTQYKVPQKAVTCGSDLRAVTPRELLGLFFGLRARHLENTKKWVEAEPDHLLARHLFPQNRYLHIYQHQRSVQNAPKLFEPNEKGHPIELAAWLKQLVELAPWGRPAPGSLEEIFHVSANYAAGTHLFSRLQRFRS